MQLEERSKYEAEFARRLARLSREHERELSESLSGNLTGAGLDSYWARVQKETEEELLAILLIIWMTSSVQHQLDVDVAMGLSNKWIKTRAKEVAKSMTATSRKSLKSRIDRLGSDQDLSDAANGIWTPARFKATAKTEVTAVNSGAIIAAGDWFGEYDKDRYVDGIEFVWRLGPCLHCQFCPEIAGTEREIWGVLLPGGPPAHPQCCCFIDIVPAYLSPGRRPPLSLLRQIMDLENIHPWPNV